jgi:hypothetical protein
VREPSSGKPLLRRACGFQQFLKLFESQFESDLLSRPRNDKKPKDEIVRRLASIDFYYGYLDDADLFKRFFQFTLPLLGAQPAVLKRLARRT